SALAWLGQQLLAQFAFERLSYFGVLNQISHGVLLALTDLAAVVCIPGARLLDQTLLYAEVNDLAVTGNTLTVVDLELALFERRRHFVLHHLHARFVAHHFFAVLDGTCAADVQTDGGVELEC